VSHSAAASSAQLYPQVRAIDGDGAKYESFETKMFGGSFWFHYIVNLAKVYHASVRKLGTLSLVHHHRNFAPHNAKHFKAALVLNFHRMYSFAKQKGTSQKKPKQHQGHGNRPQNSPSGAPLESAGDHPHDSCTSGLWISQDFGFHRNSKFGSSRSAAEGRGLPLPHELGP